MRTMIVFDSDTEALVWQALGSRPALKSTVFVQQTFDSGPCLLGDVNFNHLAAELEDEELVAKLRREFGKD